MLIYIFICTSLKLNYSNLINQDYSMLLLMESSGLKILLLSTETRPPYLALQAILVLVNTIFHLLSFKIQLCLLF
uniref:Uncharacterized protein n=1 Tax=Cannabis sativa TaxID=3483 RepID=A0A803QVU7_CANSA